MFVVNKSNEKCVACFFFNENRKKKSNFWCESCFKGLLLSQTEPDSLMWKKHRNCLQKNKFAKIIF